MFGPGCLMQISRSEPLPDFCGKGAFSVQPMEPESVTRRFLAAASLESEEMRLQFLYGGGKILTSAVKRNYSVRAMPWAMTSLRSTRTIRRGSNRISPHTRSEYRIGFRSSPFAWSIPKEGSMPAASVTYNRCVNLPWFFLP